MMVRDGSEEALTSAEAAYEGASRALDRQLVLSQIKETSGLVYRAIDADENYGPFIVAYDGELVGEVHQELPNGHSHQAFQRWYATPSGASTNNGPFVTARAAAASLVPGREPKGHDRRGRE
jgi:hypothetical protein